MRSPEFKIKNYTTEVSAEKSIFEIEQILASFGAQAVIKEYGNGGQVVSLSFKIDNDAFKLPAKAGGVYKILFDGKRVHPRKDVMKNRDERSYRITWRIIKDWTHSQLSLIASGQAQPQEVFFPYMYDGKQTLYQRHMEGRLLKAKKRDD